MRVRQWAVVGAALVAAWAGGTGVAQATEDAAQGPGCTDLTSLQTILEEGASPGECGLPPGGPGDDCGILLTTDDGAATGPCSVVVTVDVTGDCQDPETFLFFVDVTGLAPDEDYLIAFGTDEFAGPAGEPFAFEFPFTTDGNGDFTNDPAGDGSGGFEATEGAAQAPATGFTLYFGIATAGTVPELLLGGVTEVEECEPVETEPVVTQPTTPATPPAAPVAAPVAVTPVAAHPAVLANTGTPVTSAALLGGGLLVAGTGALVAARRRA